MSSQKEDRESGTERGGNGFGWLELGVAGLFSAILGGVVTFWYTRPSEQQCNASAGPSADAGETDVTSDRQETFRNRPLTSEACAVCLEDIALVVTLPCGHRFHKSCAETWVRDNGMCPLCKTQVSPDQIKYSV